MKKIDTLLILAMLAVILAPFAAADTGMSVSISKYEPYPATPGQTVKVWLLVQNTGDTDLKNINVEVIPQSPFTAYNEESVKTIDILGAHKDYLIDFNLKVDDNAVEGYNNLKIKYEYNGGTSQEKDMQIYVQTKDATLSITNVEMTPSEISPGSDAVLTITIKNTAPTTMTDLSMKLQLQAIVGSSIVDLPFAPMDSSSERRVFKLESGQSTEFKYTLRAYPDATSKVYKIPFTLTYYDSLGEENEKSDYIGIIVNGVPDISAMIDKTELSSQVRTGQITLKIINKGVSDIKFLNVILHESPDYEILSNSDTTYVGNLVSDDYQTAEYDISVLSKENKISLPVTLQYRDSNNKYYETKANVELNLVDAKKLGTAKSGFPWGLIIIIVVAAAGFWYFKIRNRKNKKGQFYQ